MKSSFRDYPLRRPGSLVEIPGNVWITVRDDRGKRVPQHCRHNHNIFVDLGREYLARVVFPNVALTDHEVEGVTPGDRELIKYMGVGIGGDSQTNPNAYATPLSADYPPASPSSSPGGVGNLQTDDDLTITQLERPVKISSSSPVWLAPVLTPRPATAATTARFDHLFTVTDINTADSPNYPVVPLSEIGLFLSTADPDASNVYDSGNLPSHIGAGRQTLVAYNTFEPIPKTVSFSLEIRWELRF